MAGLIDLDDLSSLANYSVYVSGLSPKKKLDQTDTFLLSKKIPEERAFDSKNVTYDTLSSATVNFLSTLTMANITGSWNFIKNNMVLDDTSALIESLGENPVTEDLTGYIAVNLDYLYNYMIKKIYDLSTEIYGDEPHLPSYVGQIVVSSTLSTLKTVQKVYGQNTTWLPINDRFIAGHGNRAPNTTTQHGASAGSGSLGNYGGEVMVFLDKENIVNHTHKFDPETENFSLSWHLKYGELSCYLASELATHIQSKHRQVGRPWSYGKPGDKLEGGDVEFSGEKSLGTSEFGAFLDSNIYGPDDEVPMEKQDAHNNMPPFVTKYIWERTG